VGLRESEILFKADKFLSLPELKILFNEEELLLVKKGNRLSIIPVEIKTAKIILEKIKSKETRY